MIYFVRSEDGQDYRVGTWVNGTWVFGTREDAVREARALRTPDADGYSEPTAYAWGRSL